MHNIINVPIAPLWRSPEYADTTLSSGSTNTNKKHAHKPPSATNTTNTASNTQDSAEHKLLYGRDAYRQAILQRLIPSLRAFNPSLILISAGFDAAAGDVGNCRHRPGAPPVRGMDLSPEDFAWTTREILKIADICCQGRLVSVLEGGYGAYDEAAQVNKSGVATRGRTGAVEGVEIDSHAVMGSYMNRQILAEAVVSHVHSLMDPYNVTLPAPISTNPKP